jgi:hypothetical protein
MRKKKYDHLDYLWERGFSPYIWPDFHNHFMKYKNYDRMHVEACKVFARYFYWDWPGEEKSNQIHPDSFYGSLIKSCFSAGYAQAKLDMKGDINE